MRYISKNEIKLVTDSSFNKYGRVIDYNFHEIIDYLDNHTTIPVEGNQYVASDNGFENLNCYKEISEKYYGCQDIQFGYCNGKNNRLNALEYHSSNEINVAATDLILLLGDARDIESNTYKTDKVEAFLLKRGQGIEIFTTTLHFSPIRTNEEGFKCAVFLPRFTNNDINFSGNDLLFKNNKWILTHPENEKLMNIGIKGRLVGENIEYKEE